MNLLIALDDEVSAATIIKFVGILFSLEKTKVRLIHAMNPIMKNEHPIISYPPFLEPATDSYKLLAETMLQKAAKDLHSKLGKNCVINADVVVGLPERVIEDEASQWPADLVVLGRHNRSDVNKELLGSVSADIIARSPCDVMVVNLN